MQIRVYYEDTDAGGIVYHANYIKYCERARSDIFFAKGLSPVINNMHFVVSELECKFFKPAKLGDVLEVKTIPIEIKNASLLLKQTIYKENKKIFEMRIKLCFVDMSGKITKIPQELKTIFG